MSRQWAKRGRGSISSRAQGLSAIVVVQGVLSLCWNATCTEIGMEERSIPSGSDRDLDQPSAVPPGDYDSPCALTDPEYSSRGKAVARDVDDEVEVVEGKCQVLVRGLSLTQGPRGTGHRGTDEAGGARISA